MMPTRLRCCATCLHHRPGPTPSTGRCANPGRSPRSDIAFYVREGELPCRGEWGRDAWEPRAGEDRVLGMIVWGPFRHPYCPPDDLPVDLIGYLVGSADGVDIVLSPPTMPHRQTNPNGDGPASDPWLG